MSSLQQIEVQDSTGKTLGYVARHLSTGLWRATGNPPKVWLGGQEHQPLMRGRGRDAQLVVRMPEGAPLPKDLEGKAEASLAEWVDSLIQPFGVPESIRAQIREVLVEQQSRVTAAEAGRRGGARTKQLHPGLFREIGSIGGKKVAERGPEYFQEIGKNGGQALAQTKGPEHFRQLGSKGGAKTAAKGSTHYQELARKRWKKP